MRDTILSLTIILRPIGPWSVAYNGHGVYCGLGTASEVFLIFTTHQYQYFGMFFLIDLISDEPEVFLPNSNTLWCSLPEGSNIMLG